MSDIAIPVLAGAPYLPPDCGLGAQLYCLNRQRVVEVDGFVGSVGWPVSADSASGGRGSHSLVVTDELLRALATETHEAFEYWFGVSKGVWYRLCVKFALRTSRNFAPTQICRPLLFGPYENPGLAVGNSAVCKHRGRVRITALSGPIGWPRCIPNLIPRSVGRPQLLVNDELIRAVSSESNLGFAYWFGVHVKTCTRIRQHFGILDTPGSTELHRASRKAQPIKAKYVWTPEMIALVGTAKDDEVAWHLGITGSAVQRKRQELKIPAYVSPFSPQAMRKSPNRPPDFLERSLAWDDFRQKFIVGKTCAACGGTRHLDVHHVKPHHVFPELDFDEGNLLILCDDQHKNCHHRIGHNFEWKSWNPHAVEDAALSLKRIREKVRKDDFFADICESVL